jgi:diguanylate cyclase (GGDEF)-like protein/PAS domain S-box-containing protein
MLIPPRFGRRSTFVLAAALVVLSALAATLHGLWLLRAENIDRRLESAALIARALEDHLTQNFNVIDRTLANLAGERPVAEHLSLALRRAPYLRSLAIIGAEDVVTASSSPANVGVRLARRDFLPRAETPVAVLRVGLTRAGRDFRDARELAHGDAAPATSFIPVERDVQLPDDNWVTLAAAVNTDFFLNMYGNHVASDAGSVRLLRYDGRLLLGSLAGQGGDLSSRDAMLATRLAKTEVDRYQETLADGREVFTAYRASRNYPLVLVVRLDKRQALAGWRQEAVNTLVIVGSVLLVALALASQYFLRFERVARERQRDQERLRIAAIAFESREGMLVTDAQGVVLQINQAFTQITGYTAREAIGVTTRFLRSGQHDATFYAAIKASLASAGAWSGEILNRHRDGSVHPHFLSISAVRGEDGKVSHYVAALSDISERKRAEESLLTLSRAVEQSPVSIIITDPVGLIQYVNPRFEQCTGYSAAEVVGQNPRVLSSGEKSPHEYREMWDTLLAGRTWQGEFHNRRKDGTLFWELASISPVFNDHAELLHFVAVKEDISARKQADEKIAELYRDFVSFLENTSDFIYFKDRHSRFRFCSQTLADITGHASWRDMVGKHDFEVFPPETAKLYHVEELPIFSSGLPLLNKIDPYFDATGAAGWISTNKWPLLDAEQRVVGLFGISRDITAQIQANEKLQLAAGVFTHAREGIMITAADGTIIDVNAAFTRITSFDHDEVVGRTPSLLNSGHHEEAFFAALWRDLVDKGHWYGEVWNRRKNGEVYAVMQTISAIRDGEGRVSQYLALFSDITPLKTHQRQLEQIAHFDALTQLPNRVLLADRLHQAMSQSRRRNQPLAVAYLDLDGFKAINDGHGHDVGDQLLVTLAARMRESLREGDTLARLGGDEFVAVLQDLEDISASLPLLGRLLAAAAQPVHVGAIELQVSASLGVTFYPQAEEVDADQLLRQSDQAMYQAKLAGKNRYHVFDAEQDRSLRGHHESLERIRRALAEREFVLYYQPKVNMRSGRVIGAEALIRWRHPDKGLLPPAAFLSVIEDHALSVELGEWVIDAALTQIAAWRGTGFDCPVSVNLSARQLQQVDFVDRLGDQLAGHPDIRPGDLELEVLETSALDDLQHVSRVIGECLAIGVRFALDDFGTGYSSLSYLKRLPVALLKIDQSFVRDMLIDPEDLAILEGVIGLAAAFRRQIIAEGVESVEHGEMLLRLGCELAQGYGIARPMPAEAVPIWADSWHPDPGWRDKPAVSRDDLALLFAGVEHRAWIAAVEGGIRGDSGMPPSMDHQQCRFGLWLASDSRARYAAYPAFHAIEILHAQVHELAAELLDMQASGQQPGALARLDELHALRDALLAQLDRLVRGATHEPSVAAEVL